MNLEIGRIYPYENGYIYFIHILAIIENQIVFKSYWPESLFRWKYEIERRSTVEMRIERAESLYEL